MAVPLPYSNLPSGSRLQVREDVAGVMVTLRPASICRVIVWVLASGLAFLVGLPLLLVIAALATTLVRGWMERGVPRWQAIPRLARLRPRWWLEPFHIFAPIAGYWVIFGVLTMVFARFTGINSAHVLRISPDGRIRDTFEGIELFHIWEAEGKEVERVSTRHGKLNVYLRDGTRHQLHGRGARRAVARGAAGPVHPGADA